MTNISKLLTALWGLLCLATVAVLLLVYANLPLQLSWTLPDELGGFDLTREGFFYSMAGAFILINILYYLVARLPQKFKRVKFMGSQQLDLGLAVSLKIQVIGFNIFLVCLMIFLSMSSQYASDATGLLPLLFYVGPAIMVLGLLSLIYWWFKSRVVAD